jgi:hypothetical protein
MRRPDQGCCRYSRLWLRMSGWCIVSWPGGAKTEILTEIPTTTSGNPGRKAFGIPTVQAARATKEIVWAS